MADRRGSRFVAEALFLVVLAVALAFAHLDALEIAGGMLLGWLVVAALEWAAWRAEPHFGSGLPPRYYVPSLKLPPPKPLEQVDQGYPGAGGEEAPTWIASAALRAEVLGEWPLAAPLELEPELEPEPEPSAESAPAADEDASVVPLPPELPREDELLPEPEARVAERARANGAAQVSGLATARYTFEPLPDEPAPRRRFSRRSEPPALEVPARPASPRPLPAHLR
jgi:hypothetical protein